MKVKLTYITEVDPDTIGTGTEQEILRSAVAMLQEEIDLVEIHDLGDVFSSVVIKEK